MRKLVLAVLVAMAASIPPAWADFTGQFELVDNPGGKDGKLKKLKYPFGYNDNKGYGWEARAGLETDGASIPLWAQPFIGGPYDEQYIKAAVLHDHYCDRHVYGWRQTHRMFYDVLLELKVPKIKAGIMYGAVMIGGPKWERVEPGEKCKATQNCIRTFTGAASVMILNVRPAIYGGMTDLDQRLHTLEQRLSAMKEHSVDDIDAIARQLAPENEYLFRPDVIHVEAVSYPTR